MGDVPRDVSEIVAKIRAEEGERARKRLGLDWTPSDGLVSSVAISLGWRDRLRALFGRPIRVRITTWVKEPPLRTETESFVSVDPLRPAFEYPQTTPR